MASGVLTCGSNFVNAGAETATASVSVDTLRFDSGVHIPTFTAAGDSAIDAAMIVPKASRTANQFVINIPNTGIQATAAITAADLPNINVLTSSSGAVADPGNSADYQFNNASGALTFNAPDGVAGFQRCYRNATGKSGAITIQMAASNTVDLNGVNGTTAGYLLSTGALGDSMCIVSDAAHHWYAYQEHGTWSNN